MATFGANSQTETELATGVPKLDDSLTRNYKGSAPLDGSITSDTWLPKTTGIDCKLVHGDFWEHIDGKVQEEVGVGITTAIGAIAAAPGSGVGYWSITQSGDETWYISGNVNETIVGSSNYTYIDPVTNTHSQPVTTNYASVNQSSQPTSFIDYVVTKSTTGWYLGQYAAINIQTFGLNLQLCLIQMQICVPLNFGLAALTFNAGGFDVTAKGLQQKLQALGAKLVAGKIDDGGADVKAMTINITTIVIGINQFM